MTSTQIEHLRKIDAHLERLLAQSSKRTPGKWTHNPSSERVITAETSDPLDAVIWTGDIGGFTETEDGNFVASCAGNAEAGWKATRAAIADWLNLYNATEGYADGAPDASAHDKLCNEVASICRINLRHILSAFPLEFIKG